MSLVYDGKLLKGGVLEFAPSTVQVVSRVHLNIHADVVGWCSLPTQRDLPTPSSRGAEQLNPKEFAMKVGSHHSIDTPLLKGGTS